MLFPDSLTIPTETASIVRRLEDAGFEAWCVGGGVRDALLELKPSDFDIATSATPAQVRRVFRRTIPIGIEHGTIAVLDGDNNPHEVTTFRRDVKTDGRHAEVEFGVDLDADLARRDFTINAIAYHPLKRLWTDPFGGGDDMDAGIVRAVGEPAARFREDYLRILRAIRFSTKLDFVVAPPTWDAAVECAPGLKDLSAERVRDEWMKSLATARKPGEVVSRWREVGALEMWLGETANVDEQLNRFPERDPVLMTAFAVRQPEDSLAKLRCSRAEINRVAAVSRFRGVGPESLEGLDVRAWLSQVGPAAADLVIVREVESGDEALRAAVARELDSDHPLQIGDLAVSGDDLISAGLAEGPGVGRVLRALLADVLVEPENNTREYLLGKVRSEEL